MYNKLKQVVQNRIHAQINFGLWDCIEDMHVLENTAYALSILSDESFEELALKPEYESFILQTIHDAMENGATLTELLDLDIPYVQKTLESLKTKSL